jgi:hypothetical protein
MAQLPVRVSVNVVGTVGPGLSVMFNDDVAFGMVKGGSAVQI